MSAHKFAKDWAKAAAAGFFQVPDPGDAGTIRGNGKSPFYCEMTSAASETRTLADPTGGGQFAILTFKDDGGDITLTADSAYDQSGSTTITFNDDNDSVTLYSIRDNSSGTPTYAWRVLAYDGATGPTTEMGTLDVDTLNVDTLLDLQGVADALALDGDGDTTLSAPTDDVIDVEVGGSDVAEFRATGLNLGTYVEAGSTAGDNQLTLQSTGTAPTGTGANVGHLYADFETDDDELFYLSGTGGTASQLTT